MVNTESRTARCCTRRLHQNLVGANPGRLAHDDAEAIEWNIMDWLQSVPKYSVASS